MMEENIILVDRTKLYNQDRIISINYLIKITQIVLFSLMNM